MIREIQLRLLPEEATCEASLKAVVARETGVKTDDIQAVRILKRSIDARQRTVFVNLKIRAFIHELPTEPEFEPIEYPDVSKGKRVIVVGAGPGGLFAALRLIELGLRPIVVERGKDVRARKRDIARISREQSVDPESNYSFGEGGAGAYSDGKLYTRSKKRGSVEKILRVFCQHGASPSILADAHPHIGTDKLPRVIEQMRAQILRSGGEVHFQTRMERFLLRGEEVVGIETHTGQCFEGPVILATGHSARYSFVAQSGGRGVYSFCMCPGGFIVPAASGPEQIVVNGMSPSTRGSRWANSGMVVELHPEDIPTIYSEISASSPLCVLQFQEQLERMCWTNGHRQVAPAQRMEDFVHKRLSSNLPSCSYTPGVLSSPLHHWMPAFVADRLREGFLRFGKMSRGFLTNEALMVGVETRTSAPVRILRGANLQHVVLRGLFPCGEGAGYAGGIVSAAIDGERCAESVAVFFS